MFWFLRKQLWNCNFKALFSKSFCSISGPTEVVEPRPRPSWLGPCLWGPNMNVKISCSFLSIFQFDWLVQIVSIFLTQFFKPLFLASINSNHNCSVYLKITPWVPSVISELILQNFYFLCKVFSLNCFILQFSLRIPVPYKTPHFSKWV